MDRTERAIRGQGARLIDARQVRELILAASKAYKRQTAVGLAEGETFDAWRKAQLWDAARETSFRAVTQGSFSAALNHFEGLAGGQRRADELAPPPDLRARGLRGRQAARPGLKRGEFSATQFVIQPHGQLGFSGIRIHL